MEQEKRILLDCRDAALGYEGKPVWEHLNFQVHSGDYVCIVGENGSGKSTLVKSLLGLLHPMAGEIVRSPSLRSGAIGYLPQQTKAQNTPKEKSTALMHMGKLGVLELKDRCYRELSGGQQQRVLLARALCAAGELLILDEPVTGLDPAAAQELYRTLEYLNKQEGIAIVAVTHDIRSALRYADHILHAGHGTYFFGTAADYLTSPWGKRFGGDEA